MEKVFKSPIAEPMADDKLTELILKMAKKRKLLMTMK